MDLHCDHKNERVLKEKEIREAVDLKQTQCTCMIQNLKHYIESNASAEQGLCRTHIDFIIVLQRVLFTHNQILYSLTER